jgi:hypothetical protein
MIQLIVKILKLGDVEDPDVYLGASAFDWLQTEHGAWVQANAIDLTYHRSPFTSDHYGYQYSISAKFEDEVAVIYKLKWGDIM